MKWKTPKVLCLWGLGGLEQAEHFACLEVEVYIIKDGPGGQAGHGAHLSEQWIEETRAHTCANIADHHAEAARRAFDNCAIGE